MATVTLPPNAGRVYALSPESRADLEWRALVREQQADCATLQHLVETFLAGAARLSFPLGEPKPGYNLGAILETAEDMLPTQTLAEMEAEADARIEAQADERQYECRGRE
jgi:hypothetical protein